LTVDTAYLAIFPDFSHARNFHVHRAGNGTWRRRRDFHSDRYRQSTSPQAGSRARFGIRLGRIRGVVARRPFIFALPRFTAGYLGSYSMRPQLMTGFTENVELGQIGQIQKSSEVVMRVKVEGDPARFANQHWRGIALMRFDGRRWSSLAMERRRLFQDENGWFLVPSSRPPRRSQVLQYKILLEPVASDAIFVAGGTKRHSRAFFGGIRIGRWPSPQFLAHRRDRLDLQSISELPASYALHHSGRLSHSRQTPASRSRKRT